MGTENDNIKALKDALEVSPQNQPLRLMLVKELIANEQIEEAVNIMSQAGEMEITNEDDQILIAKALIEICDPGSALKILKGNTANVLLLKAKSSYMLDDMDDAKTFYKEAIDKNPTIEDTELANLVEGKAEHTEKVKAFANDDTTEEEMFHSMQPKESLIKFKDVGGLEKVKKQIHKKIIMPFQKPSLFQRFKKKIGGGILLYGPPGCGKTLLARATAGECNANFFNVVISDILDMYIGESEQRLHAIFEKARSSTPSVIFFDEVEALAGKRVNTREQTSSKLISQFLTELDGFAQNNEGVLVLAATNVPWTIDPAFRRPGRFDRILFIPPPDAPAREEILKTLLLDRPGNENINIGTLAKKTSSFSGADLSHLIETAVDEAIDASLQSGTEQPLQMDHFNTALSETKATTQEWLTTARNYARYANEGGQYDEVLDFLKKYSK
jgi:transitional endoplasmic reticulum ATPase